MNENNFLKNRDIYNYKFIGNSNAINRIKNLIKKVSPTSSRVMIYGDSGTGKDIVAREIHRRSKYKDGPFITINAALMEPENIENDFFGSVDNGSDKIGYFEAATNGTIFIDEVGEMPLQIGVFIIQVMTITKYLEIVEDLLGEH